MSLIHWWPLNGNTNDYGVNNIALINNGATVNSAGKIGKCYSFSNNNMVVATSDIISAAELSLCLWLKLSTSHSGYAQVLVLGTSGTSWNNIRCGIDINGDGRIYFNVSSGSANTYIYSPLNYKDNIWHHITGIYNNGSLQLYIDGIQVAAGTTTNVPGLSGTSIYVGGNAGGEKANNGDCLNDIRIYNHALSVKEVKEISKGLILHYNFEDEEIETTRKVYDNSGYGNNGTVNNSLQVIPGGLSGAHYINLPLDSTIIYTSEAFNKTELTYSIWFRHHGANGSSATYMFTNGRADYGGLGYGIRIANDSQIVCMYGNSAETVSNCSKDVWHLITVAIKNAVQTIYLDGALVGSFTATVLPSYSDGKGLGLGCFYYNGGSIYPSDCDFADFKIYATALSAEDILAEYNRKAAIDKNGNLFTGEIIETAGSATKIDKNSFIDSNLFATTMTLEDGSLWAPICVHYVPDDLFTGSSNTFYYTGRNIWENFGAINDLERPESNQWEFYVMQQSTVDGPFSKYRFKQKVNPIGATWEQVNPSTVGTNVTRISATSANSYAGMYWFNNSNVAMCFANGSNGNWYGCGIRAAYQGGIPGYNGETVKGWQLVYMRISKHKARMFKNGIMIPTDIIEN